MLRCRHRASGRRHHAALRDFGLVKTMVTDCADMELAARNLDPEDWQISPLTKQAAAHLPALRVNGDSEPAVPGLRRDRCAQKRRMLHRYWIVLRFGPMIMRDFIARRLNLKNLEPSLAQYADTSITHGSSRSRTPTQAPAPRQIAPASAAADHFSRADQPLP